MKKMSTFTPEKKRETMESIINFIADEFKEDIKQFKTINCTGLLMRSILYDTIKIVNERFTDKNTGLIVTEELSATKELTKGNQKGGKRMNKLQVKQPTLDSREVAGMMEMEHWKLLRKLEGSESAKMIGIIPTLTDNGIVVSDYFISSTYVDASGKENKCYKFTKMGCEFIANKFTGEKGILFTAKYVKRFNEMEGFINSSKALNSFKAEMATLVNELVSDKLNEIEDKCSQYFRPVSKEKQNVVNYIKKRLGIDKTNEEYELVKQRVLIKLNAEKWEDIPVETLVNSLNVIDESIRVIKADRIDNQMSFFEAVCTK